jgi:hypothetical protein
VLIKLLQKAKSLIKKLKFKKMGNLKAIGVQLLIVTVGVLVALKVKEQMNKAKVTAPTK